MIVAVMNHKGGVGKTTTTVGLAAAMCEGGAHVLVVDLDQQASASLSLGLDRESLDPSMVDVLNGSKPMSDVIRRLDNGLHLVPAAMGLIQTDLELSQHPMPGRLKDALGNLSEPYDFIFLDCPPSISRVTEQALVAADAFLVPVTPQHLALEGLVGCFSAVEEIRNRHVLKALPLLGIVLTMVDYRIRSTTHIVRELRHRLGPKLYKTEIRTNVALAEAPRYGKTIFEHAPSATGARAYWDLAAEVIHRATGEKWTEKG